MSLFKTIINTMKDELINDYKLLEKELNTPFSETQQYRSYINYYIRLNKDAALEGAMKLIDDELKLYDEAFTEDMIEELDSFMEGYHKIRNVDAAAYRIIGARLDIVRFNKAKISTKDFKRDIKTITNNIKNLSRFTTLIPPLIHIKTPNDIIKELNFDINIQDADLYGHGEEVKELRFSDTELKYLMDILTNNERKRMPRVENDYIEKHSEYLYGEK